MNQLKRFSFSMCLMFVALISSVSAQVTEDPIGVEDGPPSGEIIFRAGSSWGEHPTSGDRAQAIALVGAERAFLKAAFEITLAGYGIIEVEPPEIDHCTLYEYPYRYGAHASWSITARKGKVGDGAGYPDIMIEETDVPDFIDALAQPE